MVDGPQNGQRKRKKKNDRFSGGQSEGILERSPPCDLDAEQAVLGSILIKPDTCDEVVMIVRPDDFYDDANQRLYANMLEMHSQGQKIDITLLINQLKTTGDFDVIGGAPYLAEVGHKVANAAHAVYYAKIVREKATYRQLIDASTNILQQAYEQGGDAREMLSQAEQQIFSILDQRGSSNVHALTDVLHEAMDRIDARLKGEHTDGGVDTMFTDFDALTGGLHNSELIILAARPSMGKTALAMNIAENVSIGQQVPVLFISLEMSAIELVDRLLCSVAKVNGHRLRNGTISNDDRIRLVEKAGQISSSPMFVDDSPSRTVTEIAAAARRIQRRQGRIGLIVIDYLQLIEPDNASDPRQEQVAKMARRLKGVARELEVPILCLAQLNRQAEDSKDHRPRMSHLRESGAIEQDADVVMFVHREEYYHRGAEQEEFAGQAEIIIAKQRNGPIGDIPLTWRKEFTRFEDRAQDRMSEFDQFNSGGGEF